MRGVMLVVVLGFGGCALTRYEVAPMSQPGEWWLEVHGNAFASRAALMGEWHRRAQAICGGPGYAYRTGVDSSVSTIGRSGSETEGEISVRGGRIHTSERTRNVEPLRFTKYSVAGTLICPEQPQPAAPAAAPPPGGCKDDRDCPGELICEAGYCKGPGCKDDSECKGNRICDRGTCRDLPKPPPGLKELPRGGPCRSDDDCKGFQICEQRECRDP